jgi:hypothetical protein
MFPGVLFRGAAAEKTYSLSIVVSVSSVASCVLLYSLYLRFFDPDQAQIQNQRDPLALKRCACYRVIKLQFASVAGPHR